MSDFTTFQFKLNTGTQATPVWTNVPAQGAGTGQELRYSDQSNQGGTASASWPLMIRPPATTQVPYLYVFTADTTSLGSIGSSTSTPTAFNNNNYNELQLSWDNTGTFASAPIVTAYPTTAHGAITRNDGSLLGGSADTTSGSAFSYLKANMYGSGATTQVPSAAATNIPVVTDGTVGSLSPGSAAWLTHYQDLQGDNDYITYGSTPTATTAQVLYLMLSLFTGPGMNTNVQTPVLSSKYTWV